jgi:hypothetical protein
MAITPAVALSSSLPYKSTPRLPIHPHPCLPSSPPSPQSRRRRHLWPPSASTRHPLGLLASSLASRSARTRIPCPGALLPPPDRGQNLILRACPRSQPPVADARELHRSTAISEPLVSSAPSFSSSWSRPHSKRSPVAQDRANSGDAPATRRHLRPSAATRRSGATPADRSVTNGPD